MIGVSNPWEVRGDAIERVGERFDGSGGCTIDGEVRDEMEAVLWLGTGGGGISREPCDGRLWG